MVYLSIEEKFLKQISIIEKKNIWNKTVESNDCIKKL